MMIKQYRRAVIGYTGEAKYARPLDDIVIC